MPVPEARANGRCAACGAAFHCGVADARPCWCSAWTVDPARLAALVAADAGCLCPACLAKVSVQAGKTPSAPPHA
jgi:Cysteine-rich CWC